MVETAPPCPSEAIILANLLSTIADALKKAALDLRMTDTLARERVADAAIHEATIHEILRLTALREHGLSDNPDR